MGVLNVTPDSFSDGPAYFEAPAAIRRGLEMAEEGADIIDVGGESTRPGAEEVPEAEELRRVIPVVRALAREVDVPISIDTRKAAVARAAVEAGAQMVNDVSGLRFDPQMARVVARLEVPVVVMHMRGTPATMSQLTEYRDVVVDSAKELRAQLERALEAGVLPENVVVDPGIGFAKTAEQNLELLRRLSEWRRWFQPYPLLVGTSRKSFIGKALGGLPVTERLEGTAATVALAVAAGADMVRVHDVQAMRRVAQMADALVRGPDGRMLAMLRSQTGAAGASGLTLTLQGMSFSACHGVHPEEKRRAQPFLVDVTLDLRGMPEDDRLQATVDYGQVYRWVQEVVEGPPVDLIETLAERIARRIADQAGAMLERVRVTVHKPAAPLPGPAGDVAAQVELGL